MTIPNNEPADNFGGRRIDLVPEIIAAIMMTVKVGWQATSGVAPDTGEVEITERLREAMRRTVNERKHRWSRRMVVLPGTETLSRPNLPRPDGRTDIPIFLFEIFDESMDHDPHAIIECKRIAGDNPRLCREYVNEGIDRFQSGKYGGRHTVDFMAGYVLRDDAAKAAHGINLYLTKKDRDSECLEESKLLKESWAWTSCHSRSLPSGSVILHHAFLEFLAP